MKAEIAWTRSELKAEIDAVREDTKALQTRVAGIVEGQARLTGAVEVLFVGMGRAQPGRESESAASPPGSQDITSHGARFVSGGSP